MGDAPQVVLFGAIAGGWREQYIIPLLDQLGVTYYNPIQADGWTRQSGDYEAEVMARCETIVMVINKVMPAFTSLVETGWAALGAAQRGQHFILQIDLDYVTELPETIRHTEDGQKLERTLKHYNEASRYMAYKHAQQFKIPTMYLVHDMEGVITKLREIYARSR